VVALSLMLTPLIMIVNDLLVQPRFVTSAPAREADAIDDNENPVIIAGFGRFGQIVGRQWLQSHRPDHDPVTLTCCGALASGVYDVSRFVTCVRGKQAKLFVAIDDRESAEHC